MSTTQTDTTLTIIRNFAAAPEDVFDAFASVEAMKAWFGPGPCQVLDGEMDFRVGGTYALRMSTRDGEVGLSGAFECIERARRLVFTWAWRGLCDGEEQDGHVSTVTILLARAGAGTKLTLLHEGLESAKSRDDHHQGWTGSFDKMAERFA